MNNIFITDTEEIRFLLTDVIKVNVLTYADAFKENNPDEYFEAIEKAADFALNVLIPLNRLNDMEDVVYKKGRVTIPSGINEAWKKLWGSDFIKSLVPKEYGGLNFPESVRISIQEILLATYPAFYYFVMLTLEAAKMIEQYGSESQKQVYCPQLYSGNWTGTLSATEPEMDYDWDNIKTKAVAENDYYRISGIKSLIMAGDHDMTGNIAHLVLAKMKTDKNGDGEVAWFIVPSKRPEKKELVENDVTIMSNSKAMGLKGIPFCTLEFGSQDNCRGYLLGNAGIGYQNIQNSLNSFRLQVALQGVSISGCSFRQALNHACRVVKKGKPDQASDLGNRETSLISYPQIADSVMYMKAINEGLRGAVYTVAFFADCSLHGGKEQKEFFSDLTDLYTRILKVHATSSGLEVIKKGIQVLGKNAYTKNYGIEQNFRDLQAGTLLGGINEVIAQELLEHVFKPNQGRRFHNLIKQFESVEVHQAKSESMIEAIAVWQDYIGGLIVLFDDIMNESESIEKNELNDPRLPMLWAGRVLRLFGDVIICYHLICQGLEAEKKLEKEGINFYNLQQEVFREPSLMKWYDRLITVEYFALNVLAEHESSIHIIQRNSSAALEAFFSNPNL